MINKHVTIKNNIDNVNKYIHESFSEYIISKPISLATNLFHAQYLKEIKMINYRPHRGSLVDSLAESIVYNSFEEMHKMLRFDSIKYCGYDHRIDQEVFIVVNDKHLTIGFIFYCN